MADQRLILIVDDDYDFLEINRHILEKAGFRVATASSPAQAMERIAGERPDLVITDLMMSEVDSGFSLSRLLRDDPATAAVPIIMSTSVTTALGLDFTPRSAADLASMKVDAYFDKPLDAAALVAKVRELLGES
jgi:chemosensory pili system protein ChpA (sensor histidine kinase/response regulator)